MSIIDNLKQYFRSGNIMEISETQIGEIVDKTSKQLSILFGNISTQILENNNGRNLLKNISEFADKKQSLELNPFVYFSAGEALIDKDRDYNIDSRQIQSFFKPIDNLFGDYEVRKKFNLHTALYINSFFSKADEKHIWQKNDIDKLQIEGGERKIFKLFLQKNGSSELKDKVVNEDAILIFVLLFDKTRLSLFIECFLTDAKELALNSKNTLFAEIDNKIGVDVNIIQVFALDPEKLIQCIDLDVSRQEHFQRVIARNENIEIAIVKNFIDKVKNYNDRNSIDIYKYDSIEELLNVIAIPLDDNKEKYKKLVKDFQKRKYKLKSFEGHKYFKVRIGYEDNRYVLFLHPYDSESNGPVRFPPQQ
jgi:hypothetical protein